VLLLPRTPESTRWVANPDRLTGGEAVADLIKAGPRRPNSPPFVRRIGRLVYGYGAGRFEFNDLPPGDYYIIFRPWELPRVYAVAEVSLGPSEQKTDVEVTTKTDKGGW
jgi:hypothetical protein